MPAKRRAPVRSVKPTKLPKRAQPIPVHKLPPNIFNTIVGLLDSPSLLQLAKSHAQIKKLVRESEKHWKEVHAYADSYFIDYNFYDLDDAQILLANSKIEHFGRDAGVPDARGLIDLPNELIDLVVAPLDAVSILELAAVHQRLTGLRQRVKIDRLLHKRGRFSVHDDSYEPVWHLMDDSPDDRGVPIKNPSVLDGLHVRNVIYQCHDRLKRSPPLKVKPTFTCQNFFYGMAQYRPTRYGDAVYIDKEIVQDILKPVNVYSQTFMEFMVGNNFPEGVLMIGIVQREDLNDLKRVYAPRMMFGTRNTGKPFLRLLYYYIDEWMAGKREIEALCVAYEKKVEAEDSDSDGLLDMGDHVLPPLVKRHDLAKGADGSFHGQLKRDDGKVLEVEANEEKISFLAAGVSFDSLPAFSKLASRLFK